MTTVFKEGHRIELLQGSAEYFAALAQAMDAAKADIRLETYIFNATGSASIVAQALIDAAQRGVRVHLLLDDAGTEQLPKALQAQLDAAGVQWQMYNPLSRLGLLMPSSWRRLHRKLCVVDGHTAQAIGFCGGINVLDDFYDPNYGTLSQPRFDFSIRIQGALVHDMQQTMQSLWHRQRMLRQFKQRQLQAALHSWQDARLTTSATAAQAPNQPSNPEGSVPDVRAALLLRDNLRHRKRIEQAYLKAIGESRSEIIIANAYFLPGGKLRRALLQAARRGVRITLLLQGRYEYFMQYHASRPVYESLLSAGVDIHEYALSFLHAKVAVIDADTPKAWATVGSSNLDPLSMLLAREANVVVQNSAFARDLRGRIFQGMQLGGQPVKLHDLAQRPWLERVLDHVAYALMRLALFVTGRRY